MKTVTPLFATPNQPHHASADALAAVCKAGADTLRVQVLSLLHKNSFSVGELVEILGVRQSALSHHLKVLAQAELVATRREGNSIFYRQTLATGRSPLDALRAAILAEAASTQLASETLERVKQVYQARADASVTFFQCNAEKFRDEQDLIADHYHYGDALAQLLDDTLFARRETALEIGPGDGAFLQELSQRFSEVTALDTSAEMLSKAKRLCESQQLQNIEFLHADTASAAITKHSIDCAVINMVLHHVPAPSEIFLDAAKFLAPQGILTITELCRHEQTWAHRACGDLWLGFEPEELTAWARAAGLSERSQTLLAQRNGFQIQIRQFQRLQ
ncbi:ArsR/SmtB family transcription factor [Aequoribacter sp.]|uniref:ArsR/SmtB family transcription factor n=1 Tax=Aequoribacter sp. TaxID=2847771 RepID=UPI003F698F18